MKNDVRSVSRIIDGGGILVFWNDDEDTAKYKKGFVLDMSFCDNLECHYAHFWALGIDERFQDLRYEDGKVTYHIDKNADGATIQDTSISGNIQVDTFEINVTDEEGSTNDVSDLLSRISLKLENINLREIIERRYRYCKNIDRDSWKQKDWSWWQPGEVVGWFDVFSDDPDMLIKDGQSAFVADDMYCITPGCRCKDIFISILDYNKKENLGLINIDTSKWTIGEIQAKKANNKKLRRLWEELNEEYPDLKERLKKRQKEIKTLGKEIAQMSGNLSAESIKTNKVGRNAPCPCGSGKKFKKCCMDK